MGMHSRIIIVRKQNKRCNVMVTVLEMQLLTTIFSSLKHVMENGTRSTPHRLTHHQISQLVIVVVTIAEIVMNFVSVQESKNKAPSTKCDSTCTVISLSYFLV